MPLNVQSFLDRITSGQCTCGQAMSDTYYSKDERTKSKPDLVVNIASQRCKPSEQRTDF